MDDDNGLQDALRKFTEAWLGEDGIARFMEESRGWTDGSRQLPAGPKTREQVLDFVTHVNSDLTDFFLEYHATNGTYPEFAELFPPGSPVIGKLSDPDVTEPRLVLELGPPAVWRGSMSDEVRSKIVEYATHYVSLPESPEAQMANTPEGREKVLEFLTNRWAQSGLADALEKHYAATGRYPDYADLPKFNLKICF